MSAENSPYIVLDKVERLVNKVISLDENALKQLASLDKKIIEIDVEYTSVNLFFEPHDAGIALSKPTEQKADVVIKGSPSALLGMVSSEKVGAGDVQITGNVGLAQSFQAIFKNMDVDWEELLSNHIGDIAAHKAGNVLKQAHQFIFRSMKTIGLDVSEYLRFEKNAVLDETELEEFNQAVDHLRNDVDRLTKRFERLERLEKGNA